MARCRRGLSSSLSFALWFALWFALAALGLAPTPAAQSGCDYAIRYGMNPSFQTWSSRAIVFADAFQRARELSLWQNGPLGPAVPIPPGSGLLGAGWPDPAQLAGGERFGAMLFGSMQGTLPDGRVEPYVVTWKGAGEARLEGVYVRGERNRGAKRVEVFVDPTRGNGNTPLSISWSATDPADPVRDVHVWLPGMETRGEIFWPPFLDKVRAMNAGRGPHTWRTLDWTRVNEYGRPPARGGFVFDRAGVITPESPSQGTLRGVAVEYQVALCNALGMNLHLQLPHRTNDLAEDEYRRFLYHALRVVRDGAPGVPGLFGGRRFARLDPSLTVTVELSNEIWNALFPVNHWMASEATRKGLRFSEQVASQVQLLFDVARKVFDGPDAPRLRTFVGGFVSDPGFIKRILSFLRANTEIDALGPAAYLAPRRADMDAWLVGASGSHCPNCPSEDDLLAVAEVAVDTLRPLIAQHRALAASWTNPDGSHPMLELYEGGQNFKSSGQPWSDVAHSVQTRPELFDLFVNRYVPMLVDEGVELVNWYSFMTDQDSSSVDAFGVWDSMEQTITLPVELPYRDEGAPKAALVCLGPPLVAGCALASASFRSAPGNVDNFSASAPVLGRVFRASVDLRASANDSAFVVASLLPSSIPLPSGPAWLSGVGGAEFLPLTSGPIAAWELLVPNDPSLAGIVLATQAFELGGGAPVNLSNAMDLTFGR